MHPIIRQIVDRCHVGEDYLDVCGYVISRLRNGRATYRALPRAERRALLRACFYQHYANRKLYRDVMLGRLN